SPSPEAAFFAASASREYPDWAVLAEGFGALHEGIGREMREKCIAAAFALPSQMLESSQKGEQSRLPEFRQASVQP
ncbi:MAG: hypothetical protein KF895_15910, partial [Parvibaculum sp.]|nr:hypothetical protein [Parvibaculum sp.]